MKHFQWLLPVALLASFLLAGCYSATVNNQLSFLLPTDLHATRTIMRDYHLPPFNVTIRNSQAVQQLYAAAYALPVPSSSGFMSCPSDIGLVYSLDFLQSSTEVQTMDVNVTGCPIVLIGADHNNAHFMDDAFSSLLAKTLGIPSLIPASLYDMHQQG